MTTSGTATYSESLADIINGALRKLGVLTPMEIASAEEFDVCKKALNRMVKAWEANDISFWKDQIGTLFLRKNWPTYRLAYGSVYFVSSYGTSKVTVKASAGDSTIYIDTVSFSDNDTVLIEDANNDYLEATVLSHTSVIPYSITINKSLIYDVDVGRFVYGFSASQIVTHPLSLSKAVRTTDKTIAMGESDQSLYGIDTPLTFVSINDYFDYPSKFSMSDGPTIWTWTKELSPTGGLDFPVVRVWPSPANVNYKLKFLYQKRIEDFVTSANTPDFPQAWIDCLVYNLAVEVAAEFKMNSGDNYKDILIKADKKLQDMIGLDKDPASIYMCPSYKGGR
jgi:hypothetical protein